MDDTSRVRVGSKRFKPVELTWNTDRRRPEPQPQSLTPKATQRGELQLRPSFHAS